MENDPPSAEALALVEELEARRIKHGYKPGWLFFECQRRGLTAAFEAFQQAKSPTAPEPPAPLSSPKLTIELVPSTCWFENLRTILHPDHWKLVQRQTFQAARYRCEICGGRGPEWPVECHERWHYDDEQLVQELIGLWALCPACHEVKHIGLASLNGRGEQATAHLAQVNGWDWVTAQRYVAEQFALWEERSRYEWTLDLTSFFSIFTNVGSA